MSQISFGIPIKNKEEGDMILRAIETDTFKTIIDSTKWGAFQTDYRMFKYFKKDFWKTLLSNTSFKPPIKRTLKRRHSLPLLNISKKSSLKRAKSLPTLLKQDITRQDNSSSFKKTMKKSFNSFSKKTMKEPSDISSHSKKTVEEPSDISIHSKKTMKEPSDISSHSKKTVEEISSVSSLKKTDIETQLYSVIKDYLLSIPYNEVKKQTANKIIDYLKTKVDYEPKQYKIKIKQWSKDIYTEIKSKKKTCKKISNSRCTPHSGEMDSDCKLSVKNRCVFRNSFS